MYVNVDWFYMSHRAVIGKALKERNFDFTVFADYSDGVDDAVRNSNNIQKSALTRRKGGIFNILLGFFVLLVKNIFSRPRIIHAITAKPIVVLGLISFSLNINFIGSITGLGPAFSKHNFVSTVRRLLLILIYRLIFLRKNSYAICQSQSDIETLINLRIIDRQRIVHIPSSGVNLDLCIPNKNPGFPVLVVMAARMLRSKGVEEYLEAARILTNVYGETVNFYLAGPLDPDSGDSYSPQSFKKLLRGMPVEYLGNVHNLCELLSTCDIFVLPSYYPEGIPKVLIEAAACGCAVVTSDHGGCSEALIPNVTGKLVSSRNATQLAEVIDGLISEPEKAKMMGIAGRQFVKLYHDEKVIVEKHLNLYHQLLGLE